MNSPATPLHVGVLSMASMLGQLIVLTAEDARTMCSRCFTIPLSLHNPSGSTAVHSLNVHDQQTLKSLPADE